ncbi:MAG: NAD(P)/FAD-dependent oxidoreductase [Minwuia sp.]|uniref:NAD(P)/FAD-dependent oxidoreductase n=1 Tax=Minwuia sp. TaxID=2493630 RepID=UPI003A89FF36
MIECEIAVIGGGIAGYAAACFLAEAKGSGSEIALIERESQPGYHTTGRSAAMYTEVYGNATIRAMVRAARPFLENPERRFADRSFLAPRGALMVANETQAARIDAFLEEMNRPDLLEKVGRDRCLDISPALDPERVVGGVYEAAAMDIDVHALLQAYVRVFRGLEGRSLHDAEVRGISGQAGAFEIETAVGTVKAGLIVNASGAWGDMIGQMAGAAPVGLVPMRRTAITFDPPAGMDPSKWPLTFDIDEEWYFKPDAGRILASPADETPAGPSDAQPEELDIAICIDRIETATTLQVRRPASRWAGLRCFVDDHSPVNGFDDKVEGFYWLIGQGGYGIKTSSTMARIAAARITAQPIPDDILAQGLDPANLAVERLR